MMDRDEILDLAEKAGFGIQSTMVAGGEKLIRDIWGGWSETNKVIRFAQLLMDRAIQDSTAKKGEA